jgi:hypothetical protein
MSGAGRPRATRPRYNFKRRALGIALCALPVLLAVACGLWPREVPAAREAAGSVLVGAAVPIAGLNLSLSYRRLRRDRCRRGSPEGERCVSALPLLGTLLAVGGCLLAFGSAPVGWLGVLATLADPEGLPWFPVRTWRDASLWDR